eukprot:3436280-Amphidinium_carterae.1
MKTVLKGVQTMKTVQQGSWNKASWSPNGYGHKGPLHQGLPLQQDGYGLKQQDCIQKTSPLGDLQLQWHPLVTKLRLKTQNICM